MLDPGAASPEHALSREEVFFALRGGATASIDGTDHEFGAGDCLVVPPGRSFRIVAGDAGFEAVCAMPADGTAELLPDGPTITPPWAA